MKRTTQKMYAVLLTFVMLCGCLIIPTPATVEAAGNTKLKVTSAKTVVVGKTIKIKTNVKAKFKSSNKKIATVSSKGAVKGKKAGKVKITVTSKSNKKQKKVIKITVKKKPNTTVTTEKPTPSPNPKPTTEAPSTKPTTQAPTTQAPTTEKRTTENTTTEAPTEKKVVGIEANYRGSKVPNDLYMITILGTDVRLVYSDGTKEDIVGEGNCKFDLLNETSTSATYKVEYGKFSTQFSVELFDTNTIYPYQLNVGYVGEPLEKGEIPKLEDLEATVLMNDVETEIEVDKSKLKIIFIEDIPDTSKYEFVFVYDYTFVDENGNELFVSRPCRKYIPHK